MTLIEVRVYDATTINQIFLKALSEYNKLKGHNLLNWNVKCKLRIDRYETRQIIGEVFGLVAIVEIEELK